MDEVTKLFPKPKRNIKKVLGRRIGTGKFKESTSVLRVPDSQKPIILSFLDAYEKKLKSNTDLDESFYTKLEDFHIVFNDEPLTLPIGGAKLDAGFGNMIEDWMEGELEIKDYLMDDKEMSFFKIIGGLSMILAGLAPGTVAVVDRSKEAQPGDIVMAELNGKETVKYLGKTKDGHYQLIPHSTEDFPTVTITEFDDFRVVGVINTWFNRRNKKNNPFAKLR
ncbi:MAG: S24 family peptidase [Methylotenera sp.]|nr:S24 family peptidase [Methylotenera sp.]MDP1958958.1 S24 family peptidase [Methylotenera sp.]MDP2404232.1 S24 family peptidase [Methylotenera sp.]